MVAISDKFGKASISTGYATATTVKTARTEGVSVLETFDLSDFAADTPVFFVTYKKTVDPVTDKVTVTSQTSWKALVNPDNNTLTNLQLAPGYEDIGNDVGDFVECTPTSFWGNSLVEGLFVSINPDGTLKTSAVNAALGITGTTPPDWTALPVIPTVASSDGQKQYKLRYTGVDYRPSINDGFKLRIPRTGTTPTQSMAFVSASSQYASKTAPTGITFTDDFTCEAWVYLENYAGEAIISMLGATSGWQLNLTNSGQVLMSGYNGGYGNKRELQSYQSIPLGKWTHVAATLDMSGWTVATNKIFIDGIDVPLSFVLGGTNPTAIIQQGNLQLGAYNGGNNPFNGKIANARVWAAIRTPAQIRDNMNQEVPASTTGLVGQWKGNGSWNDSSTNANHLTAAGGAVNNFASHPYSATEYAIVTKVEYTGGNTDVTVFTGNGCLPNETLGATSYSTARAPYGFPTGSTKWQVSMLLMNSNSASSNAAGTYNPNGLYFQLPLGEWNFRNKVSTYTSTSGSGPQSTVFYLSTTTGAAGKILNSDAGHYHNANIAIDAFANHTRVFPYTATAQLPLYLIISTGTTNLVAHSHRGELGGTELLLAECAYL